MTKLTNPHPNPNPNPHPNPNPNPDPSPNQRGLDFPDVTEVFNLGIVGSAADYLHRAGRVGRIGQSELGRIISVLQPAEVPQLLLRVRVRVS